MPYAINLPDIAHCGPQAFGFFDDFDHIVDADRWTKVIDVGGTALVGDTVGGVVSLTGDGTDEDMTLVVSTAEMFLVADGKPITIATRLRITEGNTDDANVVFGVSDLVTTDLMVDDDAGPATSFGGAVIFKVGANGTAPVDPTVWRVASSNATAQTLTSTEHLHVDTAWHSLRIDITPVNSTTAEVTYYIDPNGGTDWIQMRQLSSNPRTPAIKHNLTITGLAEMHAVVGVKNGSANAEILDVDWISAWQKR